MPPQAESIEQRLADAQQAARDLRPVLTRQARRPFVLEITGTPKAGKTTLIGKLETALSACGWRVHVLKERASECPLPMKGHFLFNTWTTGTMLAGLIDAVDREHDIVILDRGIFDALIWLRLQYKQGQVSNEEQEAFAAFVMLERWRRLVDRVCVIEADPALAMARENQGRTQARSGSVMNPARLAGFNTAMRELMQSSQGKFDLVEQTNSGSPEEGVLRLLESVIAHARAWCDPHIAVLSRTNAERLVTSGAVAWSAETEAELLSLVQYEQRSRIEDDDHWVQVLACGVQTHNGEISVVGRRPRADREPSQRDNTALIWRGCHVTRPLSGSLTRGALADQLKARLRSDLHLGDLPGQVEPKGLVWNPAGDEKRHLGAVFTVEIAENVAEWLDEKNFKTNGRGYQLESSFVRPDQAAGDSLGSKGYTLEEWSKLILEKGWLA